MERTQLSAIVLDLLEKETGETYDTLEDSTTLSEGLGLDSLDMAGLILHIESHFGIQIETEQERMLPVDAAAPICPKSCTR